MLFEGVRAVGSAAHRGALLAGVALVLSGCATFSRDGGFDSVQQVARLKLGKDTIWQRTSADAQAVRDQVQALVDKPLSVDDAVQLALLNNPGLQASYAELGIAEADLVQASRLPNPRLSYTRTRGSGEFKTEGALAFNLFALVTVPLASEVERRRFEQVKLSTAGEMLRVASEVRRAYFQAVGAQESVAYLEQAKLAAETAAELAARMGEVGNFSRLQRLREHLFYAETTAQLARARQAAVAARERLTRLAGLSVGAAELKLPERLPALPAAPEQLADAEAFALRERFDLQAVRLQAEALARNLGLTRTTRFINVLEFGPAWTKESPEPSKSGYEIGFELPLFDWGSARVAKAEAIYMQALQRAAQAAVDARSEVREAYAAYRTAFDLARHYRDEIVPVRKRISEENLLRYNGMLIGVFELIADAREQVASVAASIDALRDYWAADADLRQALTAGTPGLIGAGIERPAMPAVGGGEARH